MNNLRKSRTKPENQFWEIDLRSRVERATTQKIPFSHSGKLIIKLNKNAYSFNYKNLDIQELGGEVSEILIVKTIKEVNKVIEYSYSRRKKLDLRNRTEGSIFFLKLGALISFVGYIIDGAPIYLQIDVPD